VFRDAVATTIPETLTFFRKPIPALPPPPEARVSPLIASQASAAALEAERAKIPISIYGSVSASDIIYRIRTLLANEPELASLRLEPQHVAFLGLPEDSDRLKALGRVRLQWPKIRWKDAANRILLFSVRWKYPSTAWCPETTKLASLWSPSSRW
jgi:hypothetical protein